MFDKCASAKSMKEVLVTVMYLMRDADGVLVDGRPHDGKRWDHDLQRHMNISAVHWAGTQSLRSKLQGSIKT